MKLSRPIFTICVVFLLFTLLHVYGIQAQSTDTTSIQLPVVANSDVPSPTLADGKTALSQGHVEEGFVQAAELVQPMAVQSQRSLQAAPVITLFYGDDLHFGHIGNAQRWTNVFGNVSPSANLASLEYTLNGGQVYTTTVGPDKRRLALAGDFNIELDYTTLNDGPNQLIITAKDNAGLTSSVTVTVNYAAGNQWPMPYVADWSSVSQISEAGQVVDGLWALTGTGVRPLVHRYDRLIGLGDSSWENYEAEVPVTVYGIDAANGYKYPSLGPGVGILMGWSGHFQQANEVPTTGWQNLGALAWYRWAKSGTVYSAGLQLLTYYGKEKATDPTFQLAYNVPYIMKMRTEADNAGAVTYSYKIWPSTQSEPTGWQMVSAGDPAGPTRGSMLLVAHHVDVEFGTVTVRPLGGAPVTATPPPATSTNTPTATPTDVSANTPTLTPTATPVVELTATMLPTDLPTATPVETPGSGGTATATPINTSTSATPTTIPATATPQSCWALNLVSAGSGSDPSVTPTQSTGCPLHSYTNGELITLVANPALGWRVKQWTGITETTDTQATATLIMPNAIHWVGVTYEKSCYPITLAAVGSGPLPLALPTNSTGCAAGQYVMGESITVQASPVAPQVVIGWQGTVQDSSVAVVNSVTMPAMNHSVSVIYGLLGETPAPTATVLPTSINTPTPNTPVPTATGVPGATSTPVGPTPSVTPTSQSTPTPTSCHPLTLVVSSENGSLPILSPSSSDGCAVGFYLPGEQITITAEPSADQSISSWNGTIDDASTTVSNQIVMPEGAHQVAVSYGKSQPTGQQGMKVFLPLLQ